MLVYWHAKDSRLFAQISGVLQKHYQGTGQRSMGISKMENVSVTWKELSNGGLDDGLTAFFPYLKTSQFRLLVVYMWYKWYREFLRICACLKGWFLLAIQALAPEVCADASTWLR